jgi:hypothetical protein
MLQFGIFVHEGGAPQYGAVFGQYRPAQKRDYPSFLTGSEYLTGSGLKIDESANDDVRVENEPVMRRGHGRSGLL